MNTQDFKRRNENTNNELRDFYKDKIILITGGAGSIGSELARKILEYSPKVVRLLDINETGLFYLKHKLKSDRIRLFIGDIRDKDRLRRAIEDVDIVFHTAALKHVPLCEYNPFEAIKTNVFGTQNLLEVAIDENVEKFITISTDKAVNPVNVLGATKLLAERLTISANLYKGSRRSAFSCVRFGNVLGTRGSVFSVFFDQIRRGGPVTITDVEMTRFIMDVSQAVNLILKATKIARGGEIFVLKMPAIKIIDLAHVMIEILASKFGYSPEDIEIKIIGKRPGEKIHEELMTEEEAKYVYELDDMFVIDSFRVINGDRTLNQRKIRKYSSDRAKCLTRDEIKALIEKIMEQSQYFY